MLLTVSGLLVVLIGLRMWGVPFLRRISPKLTRPCRFRGKAFAVGLLTGLMPCGALSSMWIFAASSGSWASGAVSMLAFGAGTCVFMLLFGLLGTFLPKRYNKYLLKGSTILIVALGLILMTKGIRLLAVRQAQAARPKPDAPLGFSDFPGDHFPASVSQYRQR